MVELKAMLQRHEAATKDAEKTRLAATNCTIQKKYLHFSRTKSLDV